MTFPAWSSSPGPPSSEAEPPNLLRYVFTDPRARDAFPDWDRVADEQVANLKRTSSDEQFVRELSITAGTEFTERFEASAVPSQAGMEQMVQPEAGELRLAYETLELAGFDDQRMIVYVPDDDATATALDQLAGQKPGGLHAVAG